MNFEKLADAMSAVANTLKGGAAAGKIGNIVKPGMRGALGKRPNTYHLDQHSGAMFPVKEKTVTAMLKIASAIEKLAAIEASIMSESYSPYAANGSTQENKDVKAVSNVVSSATYDNTKNKVVTKTAQLGGLTQAGLKLIKNPSVIKQHPGINNAETRSFAKKPVQSAAAAAK